MLPICTLSSYRVANGSHPFCGAQRGGEGGGGGAEGEAVGRTTEQREPCEKCCYSPPKRKETSLDVKSRKILELIERTNVCKDLKL